MVLENAYQFYGLAIHYVGFYCTGNSENKIIASFSDARTIANQDIHEPRERKEGMGYNSLFWDHLEIVEDQIHIALFEE